jgi:hypothetical protein
VPALISDADFRATFNVDAGVGVSLFVRQTYATLHRLVGAAAIADAEEDSPQDVERADTLRLAAMYLALHYAYPVVNNRITQDGVVKTAREEGTGGGVVLAYLTPKEVREGAEHFKARAFELLAPYAVSPAATATGEDYPRSFSGRSRVVIR